MKDLPKSLKFIILIFSFMWYTLFLPCTPGSSRKIPNILELNMHMTSVIMNLY